MALALTRCDEALLGGQLAFTAHGVDQPLAVQGGADEPGGNFERRHDGGIEFAYALPVVEADDADVFAVDENGHDGRGARLVAGDAHAFDGARRIGTEHHALAGLQHGAELIGARLVPRVSAIALAHGAGVAQRFGDPLGLDLQPLLAVGADLGERQRGAVHLRGFA